MKLPRFFLRPPTALPTIEDDPEPFKEPTPPVLDPTPPPREPTPPPPALWKGKIYFDKPSMKLQFSADLDRFAGKAKHFIYRAEEMRIDGSLGGN